MAEKVKLNKNSLREQKQALDLYREFLPTLELRKQQLQAELRATHQRVREQEGVLSDTLTGAAPWAPMLQATFEAARQLVVVDEVQVRRGNVAGVRVPVYEGVRFAERAYSLVATPPFYDAAVAFWKRAIEARAAVRILREQADALNRTLIKTTQRINLYEKVLIPQCRENIRRIKVYLGDQQTAAVCRAKIAKGKLVRAAELEAAAAGG